MAHSPLLEADKLAASVDETLRSMEAREAVAMLKHLRDAIEHRIDEVRRRPGHAPATGPYMDDDLELD